MMHGRVEYVKGDRLSKKNQAGELIYKKGEGWYINQWWSPTSKSFKNGDVIFGWQNPVPLKYDPAIHEDAEGNPTATDHKGRTRHDTYNFIKNLPPLTNELMGKLTALESEARDIMDESFAFLTGQTNRSFLAVVQALKNHFPNKKALEIKAAIVDGNFNDKDGKPIWSDEEKAKLQKLEDEFTKFSLEAPFKPTMDIASYKKNYFPYVYMPEKFIFLIEDAIESMQTSLEKVQAAKSAAKGSSLQALKAQELALEQAMDRQREMKDALLGFELDSHDDDKMLTRTKSKHYKHISNAFDVLKSRTDRGVFRNYLEHTARQISRTNLTAELINAMSMTDNTAVRDAFTSLYKRTMAMEDARSLVLGFDISDANLNPRVVRLLKGTKRFWNLMLSGPMTAIKQAYGNLEKINKAGFHRMIEAVQVLEKNRPALQKILNESGVTLFNEFFTNSIVSELEKMEADRDTINKMLQAYGQFYKDKRNGVSDKVAATRMHKKITKLWGVEGLKWENILSEEEKKQFDSKMKSEKIQRITNKLTNWAITNEPVMRRVYNNDPTLFTRAFKNLDTFISWGRNQLGRAGVMSKMEMFLRETSFVLGVLNAQKVGLISPGNIANYKPGTRDYRLAIEYGRKATNIMFDFSMSRQGVGEIYGSAAGSLLGGFSVWKTQKFASDMDLFKDVVRTVGGEGKTRELFFPNIFYKTLREIVKSDKVLAKTNPDALALKRWFRTQFVIEGLFQALFVLPIFPTWARSIGYIAGARNLGGAGSPLASLIWAPILMLINAARDDDDPWDDAEGIERTIAYHIRNLPGVGVGIGFIYDLIVLFSSSLADEEELVTSKLKGMSGYAMPAFPAVRKTGEAVLREIAD